MNANELADELENVGMEQKHYDTMQQAATMLRQQQAEIETMKNPIMQAISQAFKPEKTLTDEEIEEVAQALIDDCSYCSLHFARAILRKAQEK